ncbi:ISAs1 family transposase [Shewanella sp. NFH-SH190041]|uniref:ISAs1 family transposase n=1 Tax=Shewanella sp. NFH-SH190041 TaxID=2950245 RepID=UPI0021C3FA49|nr:ISAs1 family transposase [Shewanella sp. NFH-SH190041]BDM63905.1 ISAs1 family transposase [Shewanella sp. NFH-SH190041]
MITDAFSEYFSNITDPRQKAKISYLLFDVLFLTVCAIIAGANGWEDIEDFGEAHFDWLQSKGLFKSGLPVHDTIARIISCLDPTQFQQCFIKWMAQVSAVSDGQLIAIDGKTLRGSYHREDRQSTIHMVSAFATANGVVMGQLKTDDKSNEINALPALLQVLELKGCLVSIDAMGCQTEIAETIVNRGGDYLLAVKGNQKTLHETVSSALKPHIKTAITCLENSHSRSEARAYAVITADELAKQFPKWPKLSSIGATMSYRRTKNGKESLEYRYYISSASLTTTQFANAVRGHWGIENSLHWVLDASLSEDSCQIYRDNAAEVLAVVRHMAVNMLRSETTKKASIRRKQNIAAMKPNYLEKVLASGFTTELDKN